MGIFNDELIFGTKPMHFFCIEFKLFFIKRAKSTKNFDIGAYRGVLVLGVHILYNKYRMMRFKLNKFDGTSTFYVFPLFCFSLFSILANGLYAPN